MAGAIDAVPYRVLGPLEVARSGSVLPLGGPRQRAVLALLLLEANRVVSMDRLAEDLWDGHPPEGWVTTVQTYVFHLRRVLEPGRPPGAAGQVLVRRNHGYLLQVDREDLDAGRFENEFAAGRAALAAGRAAEAAGTLNHALGWWRGEVLADLADYAFTRPEATRLEGLRLAALEARIDADLALGRHDALAAELERLAVAYPLRERIHGQLMVALYRGGRQAEALAAYGRLRRLLADDLGIEPGEPLRRLHTAVLTHDPDLDWNAPASVPASPSDHHAPKPAPESAQPTSRPHRRVLAALAATAVVAAGSVIGLTRLQASPPPSLPADSVGLVSVSGQPIGHPVSLSNPAAIAYGDGSIWAVDSTAGTLSRIDPATRAVTQQIPVGSAPAAVTVAGHDVWVANSGDATVSRISTTANAVVQTISVGNVPSAIAGGPSGVWVANQGDGTVDQLDVVTGAVTRRDVPVGAQPDGIAVGADAVWVANEADGTVTRIDPATGQPSGPVPVGSGPSGLAVTPSAVWVANSLDLTVSRLDRATGRVTATVGVGDGPSSIAVTRDGLWVSDQFDGSMDLVDPATNRVLRAIRLSGPPQGLVATRSGLWVAAGSFAATTHRGGTVTVANGDLPTPDPAQQYDSITQDEPTVVYDGLVTLRRAAGAAGLVPVPDLAVTLPRPADGGRTYTFQVRRRIRYSNGAVVRASDFRRGLEREIAIGEDPDYYDNIVGASRCRPHPPRCDLTDGIVTDDANATVTFHLVQPDSDFLDELALNLAVPAPASTPVNRAVNGPPFVPGTGPYKISQVRPNVSLTLVRNPYFRQWSYAAQPAGYPSVIQFRVVASPRQQQAEVLAGRADLTQLGYDDQALAAQYPTRVRTALKLATAYLFFNTRLPPFSSPAVRQAVNYAIDRARILQLSRFAPGQAAVTCQILPAGFPSHQDYCPYTANAGDGAWHGPDLAKAKTLVQRSGLAGTPVRLWVLQGFDDEAVGRYLISLLGQIGFRASLHMVSNIPFFNAVQDARRKIQVGLQGWQADFPADSMFFGPVLSCHSYDRNPTRTDNFGGFCDPRADQLANQAQAAQLTDPSVARRDWQSLDRLVTDQAPWAPLFSWGSTVLLSSRVGNYQESPEYGPLLDQLWVR
jgi:YVTN family beta-propeller protein